MKENSSQSNSIVRAWAYTRVSTEEQALRENNSLGTQRSYCEQLVQLNEPENWKLLRVIEDPGYSAKDLRRPGIQELIEAIEDNRLDVVIIYKLDRLTRSLKDFYELWEIMERNGVNFVSVSERYLDSTTPVGRVIIQIVVIFAQFEREQTVQRLKDKFAQAARNGERHPGTPPYGYDADLKNRSLIINIDEAKVVKWMFRLAIDLSGVAAVARALNEAGHRTRTLVRHKGKEDECTVGGKPWNANKVVKIIQNVAYKAIRLCADGKEYPAKWKPIVSRKIWEQANRAILKLEDKASDQAAKRENFTNKAKALLKGLLFCGHCNNAMTPKAGGKRTAEGTARPYYTCQSVVQFGSQSDCTLRNVTATGFDAFVIRLIGYDWSVGGFAVHPFKLDERRLEASAGRVKFTLYKKRHILATALHWRQQLDDNPHLGTRDIATQIRVTVIRIRQILRLAKLHPTIQEHILSLPYKQANRSFSEHALRELVALTREEQLSRFSQKWPDHTLGSNGAIHTK